jgi:hypothetical protein
MVEPLAYLSLTRERDIKRGERNKHKKQKPYFKEYIRIYRHDCYHIVYAGAASHKKLIPLQ